MSINKNQHWSQDISNDHIHIPTYDVDDFNISSDNDDNVNENSNTSAVDDIFPQSEVVPTQETDLPAVEDWVETFWPIDNGFYKGSVSELTTDGKHVIVYDDEDIESLLISDENWRYESSAQAEIGNFTTLPSDEQRVLRELMHVFGNKSLLDTKLRCSSYSPLSMLM